jgi:hypothetical protein
VPKEIKKERKGKRKEKEKERKRKRKGKGKGKEGNFHHILKFLKFSRKVLLKFLQLFLLFYQLLLVSCAFGVNWIIFENL